MRKRVPCPRRGGAGAGVPRPGEQGRDARNRYVVSHQVTGRQTIGHTDVVSSSILRSEGGCPGGSRCLLIVLLDYLDLVSNVAYVPFDIYSTSSLGPV